MKEKLHWIILHSLSKLLQHSEALKTSRKLKQEKTFRSLRRDL